MGGVTLSSARRGRFNTTCMMDFYLFIFMLDAFLLPI